MALPASIAAQVLAQQSEVLRRGSAARFDKIRQRTLFSTYLFAPGVGGVIQPGQYQLFKTLKGDTGQGYANPLTDRETNWLAQGRVPDDQNLIVHAMGVDIRRAPTQAAAVPTTGTTLLTIPPHPVDVAAVAYGMTLNFQYLTSTISQGLLADFPAVGGAFGFHQASRQIAGTQAADPGTAIIIPNSGSPDGASPLVLAHMPIARQGVAAAFERRLTIAQLLAAKDTFSMVLNVPSAITLLAQNVNANPETYDATGCLEVSVQLFCTESVRSQG